jgi:hypothetical protein
MKSVALALACVTAALAACASLDRVSGVCDDASTLGVERIEIQLHARSDGTTSDPLAAFLKRIPGVLSVEVDEARAHAAVVVDPTIPLALGRVYRAAQWSGESIRAVSIAVDRALADRVVRPGDTRVVGAASTCSGAAHTWYAVEFEDSLVTLRAIP